MNDTTHTATRGNSYPESTDAQLQLTTLPTQIVEWSITDEMVDQATDDYTIDSDDIQSIYDACVGYLERKGRRVTYVSGVELKGDIEDLPRLDFVARCLSVLTNIDECPLDVERWSPEDYNRAHKYKVSYAASDYQPAVDGGEI